MPDNPENSTYIAAAIEIVKLLIAGSIGSLLPFLIKKISGRDKSEIVQIDATTQTINDKLLREWRDDALKATETVLKATEDVLNLKRELNAERIRVSNLHDITNRALKFMKKCNLDGFDCFESEILEVLGGKE